MKRIFTVFFCLLLLLPHCGCSRPTNQKFFNFYYQIKYDSVTAPISGISSETRDCTDIRDDRIKQLQRYLSGPEDAKLVSPFPEGITVISLTFGKGRAYITLSDHITQLQGLNLNIACACLVKTVAEMMNVTSVEIRAETGLIESEPFLILRSSDYEFTDGYADFVISQAEEAQESHS